VNKKSREERIELLNQAHEHLWSAIDCIRTALADTDISDEAESYIIESLENWAEGGNPYDRTNIQTLIKRIQNYKGDINE
jgi:hypothetical protein